MVFWQQNSRANGYGDFVPKPAGISSVRAGVAEEPVSGFQENSAMLVQPSV